MKKYLEKKCLNMKVGDIFDFYHPKEKKWFKAKVLYIETAKIKEVERAGKEITLTCKAENKFLELTLTCFYTVKMNDKLEPYIAEETERLVYGWFNLETFGLQH